MNLNQAAAETMVDESFADLKRQLAHEREENFNLREQIRQLSDANIALQKAASDSVSSIQLEERQRTLEETLAFVEKQYLLHYPENDCKRSEEDIMECLKKNRNKLLNCASFGEDLKKCASNFRERVLKEVPQEVPQS
ncbi:unnamed protein product [Gongylonema pulchrum]|uniref:Uncharacterized protein n=1 Tax=Gongylonema pulchrum TaxID=637853 RepID=A0A3P7Q4M0_9BILA|nr:unnamed protein product [Gongylonema pulchrum]